MDHVWLDVARHELAAICDLPEGWSSYPGRVSVAATDTALCILEDVAQYRHQPVITPMVSGGVAMRFASGVKTARVEVAADAEVVLVTQLSPETSAGYIDIDASGVAAALHAFLR